MEKVVRVFNSFEEADKAEKIYWHNASVNDKLSALEAIRYIALKLHYPNVDERKIQRVVKIRNLHDPEED